MRLKIVQAGDPVLRQATRALTQEEIRSDSVQRLIQDMKETMRDAPGVGLAAPQVGVSLQLVVIEDQEEFLKSIPAHELDQKGRRPVPFHVLINPTIVPVGDDQAEFYEGFLSLTGFSAIVPQRSPSEWNISTSWERRATLTPPVGMPVFSSMKLTT